MIYFGTDGIRGQAYETLPLLRAYQLGYSLRRLYNIPFVIGCDTRISSLDFVHAFIDGLDKEVIYVGVVPTPVLAYESLFLNAVGVMITASHNPYGDNGLKVFLNGEKLSTHELEAIETFMAEVTEYSPSVKKDLLISKSHYHSLYETLNLKESFKTYTVDAANGAASHILKDFVLGRIIHNTPDGYNINLNCGATHLDAVMKDTKHDLKFSLDGDADRLLMVYKDRPIYGDEILYIFTKDELTRNKKPKVALSIMTNPGVLKAFDALGITPVLTPVGDAYLLEAIKLKQAQYGAEASGHIITPIMNIGDGILVLKLLVDIISRVGLSKVMSWLDEIKMMPMKTLSLKASKSILAKDDVKAYINELEDKLESFEKIIVRASGTEDLIRITVSKTSETLTNETIRLIKEKLEGAL
jgi:phosphoglucosamine mutase